MELKWAVAAMIGTLLVILCIWLFGLFVKWLSSLEWTFESASRRAGKYGEERQVYLLANWLQCYRIKVWVEGYVILLHQNSPVDSEYIISGLSDIDRAIHTKGKNHLHPKEIERIITLLQRDVDLS